jgi:hydroxymethylpyrimidine/phosphomethylpyrimidine kinase
LIAAWPRLLERADLAFPNVTELALIVPGDPHNAIDPWRDRFPASRRSSLACPWAITRCAPCSTGPGAEFGVDHRRRPGHYRGTGDAFAAVRLHEHLARHTPLESAIAVAASRVSRAIDHAALRERADLCLDSQD